MRRHLLIYFGLGFISTLAGCATQKAVTSPSSGWAAYTSFKQELTQNPERPEYEHHLSSDWLAMLESAKSIEEKQEILQFAAYPRWLSKTGTYYEKQAANGLCLSVNGVAYDGSPGTLAIQYVPEGDRLKAAKIHYQYWETEEEYPIEARCPEELGLALP